jgi:uncharacterized membrane protein (DUF373 family)
MENAPPPEGRVSVLWRRFTDLVGSFERAVVFALIVLLMIVVGAATAELGVELAKDLTSRETSLLDVEEMFSLFGYFLLVLIGLELLKTLKTYVHEGVVQVEVVLEVALIAVAQKLIILNLSKVAPPFVYGLAALILTLSLAFWLVRHGRR